MMKALMIVLTLVISLVVTQDNVSVSALVPPNAKTTTTIATTCPKHLSSPTSSTRLHGIADRIPLVGRFRRKQDVKQVPQIKVGDAVPREVDVIPTGTDGTPTQIHEVLSSKSIIVGMPGAFTTTCTSEHLPGYRDSMKDFHKLGYDTIAVVTTNDRWVNEEWMDSVMGKQKEGKGGDTSPNSDGGGLVLLSDADGDFVKSMGLADDMGFGVGIRSKRFAMAVQDGIVTHIMTDEGMDDCSGTSAKVVLKAITPKAVAMDGDGDSSLAGGAVAVVGILAVVAAIYMGGSSLFQGDDTATSSSRSTTTRVQKASPGSRSSGKDSSQFPLLQNYKP